MKEEPVPPLLPPSPLRRAIFSCDNLIPRTQRRAQQWTDKILAEGTFFWRASASGDLPAWMYISALSLRAATRFYP